MMDEETYKKEIVRMWDTLRSDEYKGKNICDGVFCEDCPLSGINNDGRDGCMEPMKVFEIIKIVERWSKEHSPKKYKVSRMEYDILQYAINHISNNDTFDDFCTLRGLLDKGYFEGATGSMHIVEYYINCEVVDDD